MKIAFTGAHGTGKTTLVGMLLKNYPDHQQYTNIQRFFNKNLKNFPISSKANDISQTAITSFLAFEIMTKDNIICDRSLIDTFAYSDLSKNVKKSSEIRKTFEDALKYYDMIFYVPIEFKVEDDGLRELDEKFRIEVDKKIKYYIKKYKKIVPIYEIKGSIYERYDTISTILFKTLKHSKGL